MCVYTTQEHCADALASSNPLALQHNQPTFLAFTVVVVVVVWWDWWRMVGWYGG